MLGLVLTTPCVHAGDNVGLLLRGLKLGDVQHGQVRGLKPCVQAGDIRY